MEFFQASPNSYRSVDTVYVSVRLLKAYSLAFSFADLVKVCSSRHYFLTFLSHDLRFTCDIFAVVEKHPDKLFVNELVHSQM